MSRHPEELRLLVVEDDGAMALLILAQLRVLSCSVSLVENSLMAIQAWIAAREEKRFDAVVMAFKMPARSVLFALGEIRRLEDHLGDSRTPIIALSSDAAASAAGNDAHHGFDIVLHKPGDLPRLVPAIRALTRDPVSMS